MWPPKLTDRAWCSLLSGSRLVLLYVHTFRCRRTMNVGISCANASVSSACRRGIGTLFSISVSNGMSKSGVLGSPYSRAAIAFEGTTPIVSSIGDKRRRLTSNSSANSQVRRAKRPGAVRMNTEPDPRLKMSIERRAVTVFHGVLPDSRASPSPITICASSLECKDRFSLRSTNSQALSNDSSSEVGVAVAGSNSTGKWQSFRLFAIRCDSSTDLGDGLPDFTSRRLHT